MIALAAAALAALMPATDPPGGDALVLGVLQEYPTGFGTLQVSAEVRAAFVRRKDGWVALPSGVTFDRTSRSLRAASDSSSQGSLLHRSLPEQALWRVCFDGRSRGAVRTKRPQAWTSGHRGALLPVEGSDLPWVGAPTDWPWVLVGVAVRRPLVTTTGTRCGDPDRWKPVTISPGALRGLLPAIHAEEARVYGHRLNADEHYAVEKAYGNAHGDRLLMVTDADFRNGYGSRLLIHAARGGGVRILAEGVSVLDAGDYDGDGKSELVAMQAGRESGSIVLLWDDLGRQARFDWTTRDEE